jgi:FAD/FMN-containing dehydrogenase
VKAVAGSSLAAGFAAAGGGLVASAQNAFGAWPAFDGRLLVDDAARETYAQDYGQIAHERPRGALQPGSVDDIVEAVRYAQRMGVRIAARGSGHQPYGQAQVYDGLVIDMRSMNRVHAVDADCIDVDAGADWRAVVQAGAARGRTVPVLPAYLGLTVGGTLSVGGIGIATVRHGAQVDNAFELEVVTGSGAVVRCSARDHADLFESALAGQGQAAIITRARLRAVEAPKMVREYAMRYPDSTSLLAAEAKLLRDTRFQGVAGMMVPAESGWSFVLLAVRMFTPPEAPDDAALTRDLDALGMQARDLEYAHYVDERPEAPFGQGNAALGLLVAGSAAPAFVRDMLPRLTAHDLGGVQGIRVFTWNRESFSQPLFRIPDDPQVVYLAMLRAEVSAPRAIARQLMGNLELFEANRERGGTMYAWSALDLTRADWRRHYGDAWRSLVAAKQRYDPANVFASGPDLFR